MGKKWMGREWGALIGQFDFERPSDDSSASGGFDASSGSSPTKHQLSNSNRNSKNILIIF